MTIEEFEKQYQIVCEIVDKWPEWKKNIIILSGESTVSTPRLPIIIED